MTISRYSDVAIKKLKGEKGGRSTTTREERNIELGE